MRLVRSRARIIRRRSRDASRGRAAATHRRRMSPNALRSIARLLGGLSPAAFLARHWQRRPLLIRGAVRHPAPLPDRDALFELAARDDVESRLVIAGRRPLVDAARSVRPPAATSPRLDAAGAGRQPRSTRRRDALMRRFDFVSTMRLDDLMISYAADGGGVGPHLDSYDVFLLQVARPPALALARSCRRPTPRDARWSKTRRCKLLKHFVPTARGRARARRHAVPAAVVRARRRRASARASTASIGFRAPSWNELTQEFLFAMAERAWPDGRLLDRRPRRRPRTPAALDDAMLDAVAARIAAIRFDRARRRDFVGRHFSEPKPHVTFDPPPPMSARGVRAARRATGVALDLRATMLYRGAPRASSPARRSTLPAHAARAAFGGSPTGAGSTAASVADSCSRPRRGALLHEWWQHGWIQFGTRTDRTMPHPDPQPTGGVAAAR